MKLSTLTTPVLKKLLSLHERREDLVKKINQLDAEIAAFVGDAPAPAPVARRRKSAAKPAAARGRKSGRGGRTANKIVNALKNAGAKGMTVKQLSEALKIKTQNLYVWFNSTGRKTPGIKKIAPATYALQS